MKEKDLLNKIIEIVFSVPDNMYKYKKPEDCFDLDWNNGTPRERALLLIEDLIICFGREKHNANSSNTNSCVLNLGKCPAFYSNSDEDMFFKAIYTMPSYIEIKGMSNELYLYYDSPMSDEEKLFLVHLMKRYGMLLPKELDIQ